MNYPKLELRKLSNATIHRMLFWGESVCVVMEHCARILSSNCSDAMGEREEGRKRRKEKKREEKKETKEGKKSSR